jgi:hypothetical protein
MTAGKRLGQHCFQTRQGPDYHPSGHDHLAQGLMTDVKHQSFGRRAQHSPVSRGNADEWPRMDGFEVNLRDTIGFPRLKFSPV